MKQHINICHFYLIVCLLCALTSGFIGKIAQGILILMSLYYALYANMKYKLPLYFKALNVLLVMFTIYGVLLLISGEQLMVKAVFRETANTDFLKTIYKSLLPVYPFYVFTKQGLLKENTVKFWFLIFLLLTIRSVYRAQNIANLGYSFLALLPALVLFYKKPVIQYLGIMICGYYIVLCIKRGAILIGVVCLIWFMVTNMQKVSKKQKWVVGMVSLAVVFAGIWLYRYMMETNAYFLYRITQTMEGDSSGRDELYDVFYEHFIHEENPFRFLFGYGADATLKIGENYAHNDWLEIATNHGLIGIVVYIIYWICFYISWRKNKWHPQAFMATGMVFIIYFIATFFSMSYNSVLRCAAMVLGYYLAIGFEPPSQEMETEQLPQKEPFKDALATINNPN